MNNLTTKPTMRTTAKHRYALMAREADNGNLDAQIVNSKTQLIPRGDLPSIITELDAALATSDERIALVCAKRLIGCYRIKDVVDADIYIQTMAEKFAKFPPDVAQSVVSEITDVQVFPPAPAEVVAAGRAIVRKREIAIYTARKHLEEWERRKAWRDEQETLKTDRADEGGLEKAYAEVGVPWPGDGIAGWGHLAAEGMKQ